VRRFLIAGNSAIGNRATHTATPDSKATFGSGVACFEEIKTEHIGFVDRVV
jgi:hypothetical protein